MSSERIIHYNSLGFIEDTLTRQIDLVDSNFVQYKCPAFHHKNSRTFVAHSSMDFSISIQNKDGHFNIECSDTSIVVLDNDHLNSPKPVIQLSDPKFLFWTEDDNIWIEIMDHPMTAYNNNFITTNGWWNLSNWSRSNSIGMTIVDEDKPILIKEGDPLFRICFYSSNLDDTYVLRKEEDISKQERIVNNYIPRHLKSVEDGDWKSKLFSKTTSESRCPFKFLFK